MMTKVVFALFVLKSRRMVSTSSGLHASSVVTMVTNCCHAIFLPHLSASAFSLPCLPFSVKIVTKLEALIFPAPLQYCESCDYGALVAVPLTENIYMYRIM